MIRKGLYDRVKKGAEMDRLVELLNSISDSYYDFVVGVINYAKRNDDNRNAIISFIENNPTALSSDVLEYMISRKDYFDHAQRITGIAKQTKKRV